jgi:hypothetical protein
MRKSHSRFLKRLEEELFTAEAVRLEQNAQVANQQRTF